MQARDLIASLTFDPEATAQAWRRGTVRAELVESTVAAVDWSHVLVLALRHRVCGLLHDALEAADLLDLVPITVADALRYQLELTEARHGELVDALRELAEVEPEVIARSVLLKGGATLSEYAKVGYRPMSDFDVLFSAADFDAIEPRFAALGYWRKESLNGPTYYRDRVAPGGPLCMDVHVAGPSKYWRPDGALTRWLDDGQPHRIAGIDCRRLSPELDLLNVVTHIHEHLGSWIHGLADDDLALVRSIDVELIAARRPVDVTRLWSLAVEQELHGEFALGLWAQARVRGALPEPLAAFAPVVDLVDEVGELVAVPGGELARWPVPLAERVFRTDRLDLAFAVLEAGLPDPARIEMTAPKSIAAWRTWYRHLGAKPDYREKVESIGALARVRLTGFSPS